MAQYININDASELLNHMTNCKEDVEKINEMIKKFNEKNYFLTLDAFDISFIEKFYDERFPILKLVYGNQIKSEDDKNVQ